MPKGEYQPRRQRKFALIRAEKNKGKPAEINVRTCSQQQITSQARADCAGGAAQWNHGIEMVRRGKNISEVRRETAKQIENGETQSSDHVLDAAAEQK